MSADKGPIIHVFESHGDGKWTPRTSYDHASFDDVAHKLAKIYGEQFRGGVDMPVHIFCVRIMPHGPPEAREYTIRAETVKLVTM